MAWSDLPVGDQLDRHERDIRRNARATACINGIAVDVEHRIAVRIQHLSAQVVPRRADQTGHRCAVPAARVDKVGTYVVRAGNRVVSQRRTDIRKQIGMGYLNAAYR